MVRRCSAHNCNESDKTILAHRFPKDDKIAILWQKALELEDISLETLRANYSVCTKHFANSCYRNIASNCLNTTAIPTIEYHDDNMRVNAIKEKEKSITPILNRKSTSNSLCEPAVVQNLPYSVKTLNVKKLKLDLNQSPSLEREAKILKVDVNTAITEKYDLEQHYIETINYDEPSSEQVIETMDTSITEKPITIIDQSTMTVKPSIRDASTQTDCESEENVKENETNDDKLIKLLYPEFSKLSKVELIKIINDKNEAIRKLL